MSWLSNALPPWFSWGPAVVLFIFLLPFAPYQLWKKEHARAQELERRHRKLMTPRLCVNIGEEYTPQRREGPIYTFITLRVENPTGEPISQVVGNLVHARVLWESEEAQKHFEQNPHAEPREDLPPDSHKYPWSWVKGSRTETIPAKSARNLYVLACEKDSMSYLIPTEDGPAYRCYRPGRVEFIIDVGSEKEAFPPTRVRLEAELERRVKVISLETITR